MKCVRISQYCLNIIAMLVASQHSRLHGVQTYIHPSELNNHKCDDCCRRKSPLEDTELPFFKGITAEQRCEPELALIQLVLDGTFSRQIFIQESSLPPSHPWDPYLEAKAFSRPLS
jgi:hypothetical protein